MTPPNKLAETIKQVTKILKSPGCRCVNLVCIAYSHRWLSSRKTPVFVKNMEQAVEISEVFAKQRSVKNLRNKGDEFQG